MPTYSTDNPLYTCENWFSNPKIETTDPLHTSDKPLYEGCGLFGFYNTPATEVCPTGLLTTRPAGLPDRMWDALCKRSECTHDKEHYKCVVKLPGDGKDINDLTNEDVCDEHAHIVTLHGKPLRCD